MISSSRILSIFRTKGGEGSSIKAAEELSQEDLIRLESVLGPDAEKPLIVGLRTKESWFVITGTQLVNSNKGLIRGTDLAEITELKHPRNAVELADGKIFDSRIELGLRDGSVVEINTEAPGKPLIALMNVFKYVVRMNRPKTSQ